MGSPPMRAAMKLLGLQLEDLMPPSPSATASEAKQMTLKPSQLASLSSTEVAPLSPSGLQKRQEIQQKRRLELMKQLQATALQLDEEETKRILAPDLITVAKETGKLNVTESEKEKGEAQLKALRKRSQQEAQKIVDDQKNRLRRLEQGRLRQEKLRETLAKLRAAQREEFDKRMKKLEDQEKKKDEILRKLEAERKEETRSYVRRIREGFQKAEETKREQVKEIQKAGEKREAHIREVLERKEKALFEERQEMVQDYKRREEEMRQRLQLHEERAQTKAAEQKDKYESQLKALAKMMEEKQQEREAAYREKTQRLLKKRAHVAELLIENRQQVEERLKTSVFVEKQKKAVVDLHRAKMAKRRAEKKRMAERAERAAQDNASEIAKKGDWRKIMNELVTQNQMRLQRADEFQRQQMLAAIHKNIARVDGQLETRQMLMKQRAEMIKEAMIEKERLFEGVRRMKDKPVDRSEQNLTSEGGEKA